MTDSTIERARVLAGLKGKLWLKSKEYAGVERRSENRDEKPSLSRTEAIDWCVENLATWPINHCSVSPAGWEWVDKFAVLYLQKDGSDISKRTYLIFKSKEAAMTQEEYTGVTPEEKDAISEVCEDPFELPGDLPEKDPLVVERCLRLAAEHSVEWSIVRIEELERQLKDATSETFKGDESVEKYVYKVKLFKIGEDSKGLSVAGESIRNVLDIISSVAHLDGWEIIAISRGSLIDICSR